MGLVKQHLIVGNYEQVKEYFSKVKVFVEGVSSIQGLDDCFEIPTLTIDQQLQEINAIDGLKIGLVFYFIRKIWKEEVFVILGQEMVWIVQDMRFDPYLQKKMSEIFKHTENVEFMKKK